MSSGTLVFGETFSSLVLAWLGVSGGRGRRDWSTRCPCLIVVHKCLHALNVHVYIRRHKPLESISAHATPVAFFIFSSAPLGASLQRGISTIHSLVIVGNLNSSHISVIIFQNFHLLFYLLTVFRLKCECWRQMIIL